MQPQPSAAQPSRSIATFVIIIAIIFALGTFLFLAFLQGRSADEAQQAANTTQQLEVPASEGGEPTPLPPNSRVVLIDDTQIVMQIQAGQEFTIVEPPALAVEQPAVEAVQPEATIVVVVIEEQPVQVQEQQQAPEATAVPLPAPVESIIFQPHTIAETDTLYSISRQYVTSIALMAQYGLSQDDMIPGTVIQLPVGNPAYCPGQRPYAVGEGDTAFSIAQRYNTTAEDLRNRNNLDENYTIHLAEIICVP